MNEENKLTDTIRRIGTIGVILLPILTILYSIWVQFTPLFIFLQSYEIILYIGNLILWIGVSLTLAALLLRKRFMPGFILFIITTPCLLFSSLSLMRASPSTLFFTNMPELYSDATLGDNHYYLTSEVGDWGNSFLYLYKCDNKNSHCAQFYIGRDHIGGFLEADSSRNEINVINIKDSLIYTHGAHPRYYDPDSRTELGEHIYYLSEACEGSKQDPCNIYIYSLYKCNFRNTACNPVPFEYKTKHDVYLYLEANETTNEISIYNDYGDNKTLIYIYGEHLRCYVDDCSIVDRK